MVQQLPPTVSHFHKLPPEARVDSKALRILLGINSYATFSRRRDDGSIPDPDGGHGTWLVSTVKKILANYEKNSIEEDDPDVAIDCTD